MKLALVLLGTAVASVLVAVYYGWVGALLWRWYLVPMGVPPLSVKAATGVLLLVHLFTAKPTPPATGDHWKYSLAFVLSLPAFTLGFGWVLRWVL